MEHPTPPTRAICAVVCIRVAVVLCLAVLCIFVHARLEAHRDTKKTGGKCTSTRAVAQRL